MPSLPSLPHVPRRRFAARDLALVAVFVGIMAALGLVPAFYPFGASVPITAQSLGVMLAGAVLGARRGALSMVVFLALVAVGLPLLAGGVGGLGVFFTPRVGFLLGFPVAAYVVGLLSERRTPYTLARGFTANVVGGIGALYVFGVLGIMAVGRVGVDEAATAVALFIPGDLLKALLAALVARGVHAGYPGLLRGERGGERQSSPV
jgi:biotin transport system substrate-specific component